LFPSLLSQLVVLGYVETNGGWAMQRSQLRQRFDQFEARLEQLLPGDRRFYLAIAVAFGCLGYVGGTSMLRMVARAPINLEEPELPPVEGGANPLMPDARSGNGAEGRDGSAEASSEPDSDDASATGGGDPPELASERDRSRFTEEQNCRIWKRTFPEAAARLKPGDSCY